MRRWRQQDNSYYGFPLAWSTSKPRGDRKTSATTATTIYCFWWYREGKERNGINGHYSTLGVINSLLELGKRLQKPEAGKEKMTEEQIRMTLEKQLEDELLKHTINPLIGMAGILSIVVV